MAIPVRNSSAANIKADLRTFFVTTSAWQSRNLLQSHRMAGLLVDVLQHYRNENQFALHGFVVMPNHPHVLLTLERDVSVEKAAQLIKGGFSFRAKREVGVPGEIWHRGFSERRICSEAAFRARQNYMHQNPVRARLVERAEEWEYSSGSGRYEVDPCPEYLRG